MYSSLIKVAGFLEMDQISITTQVRDFDNKNFLLCNLGMNSTFVVSSELTHEIAKILDNDLAIISKSLSKFNVTPVKLPVRTGVSPIAISWHPTTDFYHVDANNFPMDEIS